MQFFISTNSEKKTIIYKDSRVDVKRLSTILSKRSYYAIYIPSTSPDDDACLSSKHFAFLLVENLIKSVVSKNTVVCISSSLRLVTLRG